MLLPRSRSFCDICLSVCVSVIKISQLRILITFSGNINNGPRNRWIKVKGTIYTAAEGHNMWGNDLHCGILNIFTVINIFTMSGLGRKISKNTYYILAVRILSTNILNKCWLSHHIMWIELNMYFFVHLLVFYIHRRGRENRQSPWWRHQLS